MSNFVTAFKDGQAGKNLGLSMGAGLNSVSKSVGGVQKQRIYGVAGASKSGKSTYVDNGFVLSTYLDWLSKEKPFPLQFVYLSYEIDRVSKQFEFAVFFLYHDYNILNIVLPQGVTVNGQTHIEISPNYLRGRIQDDNENTIKCHPRVEHYLQQVYINRLTPLFGKFDTMGRQLEKGIITFITQKMTPDEIKANLFRKAESEGTFIKDAHNNITGYNPRVPDTFTIVITDHLRKIIPEKGILKSSIDKYIRHTIDLRNWCQWTFIHIIHLNRSMTETSRMKMAGDLLYPNSDDIKDTGNLSEDCDYLFTVFNPNDDRYGLSRHFNMTIKDEQGNELFPDYRSIHLVENRHGDFPQHFRVDMKGNIKTFFKNYT
jgi:hypothetical protein